MRKAALLLICSVFCLVSVQITFGAPSAPAFALASTGSMTFQQGVNGYAGNSNATLDSWNPDVNTGSPTGVLSLRTYYSNGLTRFDLSALPSNAYVTQATLRLYVIDRTNPSSITLNAHRLLRPWQTTEATWHNAATGIEWEKPGANDVYLDRSAVASAAVNISSTAAFYEMDVTSLVRDWVRNPATNYGAQLVPNGATSVQYRIAADNLSTVDRRPRLTVNYSIDAANDFPPTIAITNPQHDAFVTELVPLSVDVQDDLGIQFVKYILDGSLLAQVSTPPYDYTLDTATLGLGIHRLSARVLDSGGTARDHAITFNVYRTDSGILTFGHISDMHLGTPLQGDPADPALYLQRFQQAIAELRDIVQPSVIINTGDTTNIGDTYSYGLYAGAIAATTIPVRAVPGNHDMANRENYLSMVGKTRLSFDVAQTRFIGFTTHELDATWLNNLLSSTDKKGIIFGHYLMRLPQGSTSQPWFYTLPAAELAALQQAMATYSAPAYLSGHYHAPFVFEETVSKAAEIGAPALGQKSSYAIATVDSGVVASIVHYLGDWPEVIITSPQQYYPDGGSKTISGVVAIRARAFAPLPVTSVTYAIDGVPKGAMTPLGGNVWQAEWNTGALALGNHWLTATARDSLNRTRSTTIQVKTMAGSGDPRTPSPTPSATGTPWTGPYNLRVNCGGPAYTDSQGAPWHADQPFVFGSWGYDGVSAAAGATANIIAATSDPLLYQTDRRWASSEGTARYRFSLPNGSYQVVLHFAETEASGVGQRVFNIRVEGSTPYPAFDIFGAAGANTAVSRSVQVTVDDNQINIALKPVAGQPKINAIEIRDMGFPPAVTATPTATPPVTTVTPTRTRTPTATQTVTPPPATRTATHTASRTATVTPTRTYSATATATTSGGYSRRVNAGGPSYTDTQGSLWLADQPYSAGSWGHVGGGVYSTASAIGGTLDDPLYQTERYGMSSYRFDAPNGTYEVELHFAEIYCAYASCRVFDVQINGATVLPSFNIYALAGKNNTYVRTFTVPVSSGGVTIGFVSRLGSPKISALRVTQLGQPTPTATATPAPSAYVNRVNCGGPAYTDSLGRAWQADQSFASGSWGYDGESAAAGATANAITATADPALYQSDRRWANDEGTARYRFAVPNGRYRVVLHFAESEAAQAGQRLFDIRVEGAYFYYSYDIFADAGANAAVAKAVEVEVEDMLLNVAFKPGAGQPKVNAIEIIQLS